MANLQVGVPNLRFKNSLKAVEDAGGTESDLTTPVNYSSVSAMRSRLATINASYYTSTMLDSMTVNDMVFALRNEDDPTTIADYMT